MILAIGEDKGAGASFVSIQMNNADAWKPQVIAIILNGISPKIACRGYAVHFKDDYQAFDFLICRASMHRIVWSPRRTWEVLDAQLCS